jgi:anti-anti-sigma factor
LFTTRVAIERGAHVVHLSGELGREHRDLVAVACLGGGEGATVRIEMDELSFMDCGGYGGLVVARRVLEERGGSMRFANARGEPLRLLRLIDEVESTRGPSEPTAGTGCAARGSDPADGATTDHATVVAGRRARSGEQDGGSPGVAASVPAVHVGPVSDLGATRFCWCCGGVSRSVPFVSRDTRSG